LQGHPVFGRVCAEAAWSARTGCEIKVFVDDFLPRHSGGFNSAQILNQRARSEISGTALAVIAKFLSQKKRRLIGNGKKLTAITASLKNRLNKSLMFTRQSAD
jgi:hypothetical protein